MIPINYLAVFVSAVASMVLGGLWYGPLFGKKWIALMGWSEQQLNQMKAKGGMMEANGGMAKSYSIMFVGSLVMAWVLAHAMVFASTYLHAEGVSSGLMGGFFNWLGFIAPVTLGSVLWEGKSWKLWCLNNSYYLVSLMAMGVILSLWT